MCRDEKKSIDESAKKIEILEKVSRCRDRKISYRTRKCSYSMKKKKKNTENLPVFQSTNLTIYFVIKFTVKKC